MLCYDILRTYLSFTCIDDFTGERADNRQRYRKGYKFGGYYGRVAVRLELRTIR